MRAAGHRQAADRRENTARLDLYEAVAGRMTGKPRPAYGELVPPPIEACGGDHTSPTRCGEVQYPGRTCGAVRAGGSAGESVQAEEADVVARPPIHGQVRHNLAHQAAELVAVPAEAGGKADLRRIGQ